MCRYGYSTDGDGDDDVEDDSRKDDGDCRVYGSDRG